MPASAFEPPRPSVEDALKAGRLAFVARVQALREIERRPTYTVARATLVVLKCVHGSACQRQATLRMTFTPETLRDGAMGVNFRLGSEYLLVFKNPSDKALVFGSEWPRNMDVAFVLKTPLRPLAALEPAPDAIAVENVWGGPVQTIDRSLLETQRTKSSR